jgi:hypothetical protein
VILPHTAGLVADDLTAAEMISASEHTSHVATSEHPYAAVPSLAVSARAYSLSTPLLDKSPFLDDVHEPEESPGMISTLLAMSDRKSYAFDPMKRMYEIHRAEATAMKARVLAESGADSAVDVDAVITIVSGCMPVQESFPVRKRADRTPSGSLSERLGTRLRIDDKEYKEDVDSDTKRKAALIERFVAQYAASITEKERAELIEFHGWISADRASQKQLTEEICLADVIFSYYSSFSPTNPDLHSCWRRWLQYKFDNPYKDLNFHRVLEYLQSGILNICFDRDGRPIIIVSTKNYDSTFGPEITAKGTALVFISMLYNLKTNEFDFNALRRGMSIYADLSHFSLTMMSWNVIAALKAAAIALPFSLVEIYCVNTPTFLYLLRQFAGKVLVPHAMEKIKVLKSNEEFFTLHNADRERTPVEHGGKWKGSAVQWLTERGFLV